MKRSFGLFHRLSAESKRSSQVSEEDRQFLHELKSMVDDRYNKLWLRNFKNLLLANNTVDWDILVRSYQKSFALLLYILYDNAARSISGKDEDDPERFSDDSCKALEILVETWSAAASSAKHPFPSLMHLLPGFGFFFNPGVEPMIRASIAIMKWVASKIPREHFSFAEYVAWNLRVEGITAPKGTFDHLTRTFGFGDVGTVHEPRNIVPYLVEMLVFFAEKEESKIFETPIVITTLSFEVHRFANFRELFDSVICKEVDNPLFFEYFGKLLKKAEEDRSWAFSDRTVIQEWLQEMYAAELAAFVGGESEEEEEEEE